MNPIIVVGILAVAISSAGMMISFSDDQVQYSKTVEKTSHGHAERLAENVALTVKGDQIMLKNTGSVPVHICEIRILDDQGHVRYTQKTDLIISAFQTEMMMPADAEVAGVISNLTGSGI